MRLPKAIQESIDRADQFDAATATADTLPQNEPLVLQTQVASDEPAAPVAPVTPAPAQMDDVWEHKYKTLQGMYNAEVPQLHTTVRDLTRQVGELTGKLTELNKPQTQQTQQATPLVTEKDKEAFGEDLLDLIRRSVHQETTRIRSQLTTVEEENRTLKSQLGNVSERQVVDARQAFFNVLNTKVPNWQALNQDQNFMAWLKEVDEVYGVQRQAALDDAGNKLDGDRAAAIFNVYNKLVAPATQQTPNNGLQRQVVPSTKRAGPAPAATPEKPILSQAQITAFYDSARRGNLTPEQITQGEVTINAAIAEGRVR